VDILTTNIIKRVIIVFILCVGGIILNTLSVSFPYRIHTALMMIPYFEVGRLIKEYGFCCDKYVKNSYLRFMLFFVIDMVITIINGNVDVRIDSYSNYLLFYIGGIAGSLFIFEISRLIGKCRPFEIVGRNTLCIFALNAYVPTRLKEIGDIFVSGLIRKIVTLIVLLIAVYISEKKRSIRESRRKVNNEFG
jgi:fucose 4-O-acetylase-like acetyltransferase